MNFTPLVRRHFIRCAYRTDRWVGQTEHIQRRQLARLLATARETVVGNRYNFSSIGSYEEFARRLPVIGYEDMRAYVMRMIGGERDVLWPGLCRNFAQSSGTSGGRSKFIPVTRDSLRLTHYPGAADVVAHYLRQVPDSRLFSGKGFILGGSFENELDIDNSKVHVGDLSANLIASMNPLADAFRIPDRKTALMADWSEKLPALVRKGIGENVTNISGVPSWFLTVIRAILETTGRELITDVWPNLEVFFHGGISFAPYRRQYKELTGGKCRFLETYNASEGFFGVQNEFSDPAMLLIIDNGVFYEFSPVDSPETMLPAWGVEAGGVYSLHITSCNGLWRYALGDTVRVHSTNPLKITIAGRTKSFINAFGEELMECNADSALAAVCAVCGASVSNYTAAPVYASDGRRGRHEWFIEWEREPAFIDDFATRLDNELCCLNSDYAAKRAGTIFLDPLTLRSVPRGTFDRWLARHGNGKLGGQRKIPRLSNDRRIADSLSELL